jgi:hypothetical protein
MIAEFRLVIADWSLRVGAFIGTRARDTTDFMWVGQFQLTTSCQKFARAYSA